MKIYQQLCGCLTMFVACLSSQAGSISESARQETISLEPHTREQCLSVLRDGLTSSEFWPSMHAAEALTLSGYGSEVIHALQGRLDNETDLRRRCGLARELVRAGDHFQLSVLTEVLRNSDPYGHTHACESLYKIHYAGDVSLLEQAMSNGHAPITALMAAGALHRANHPGMLQFIRSHLNHYEQNNSQIAAWLLGVIGDQSDIPALRQALSQAESIREKAFYTNALGQLRAPEGQMLLLENLKSTDTSVIADAAYMLGDLQIAEAQVPLQELLNNDHLDVRIRAAQGLLALAKTDISADLAPKVVLELPPGPGNSRNSEGAFMATKDGKILFIYSHFTDNHGDDHGSAELRVRTSLDQGKTWSQDEQTVVTSDKGLNVMSVSLLRLQSGEIALFYLAKVSLTDCRPMMRLSHDEGKTWSEPTQCITDQVGYYVLNNDRAIQLKSGRLVLPVCLHQKEGDPEAVWEGELMCYLSDDSGRTWRRSQSEWKTYSPEGTRIFTQEPGVVELSDGRVLMLIRSSAGCQMLSYSDDGGETWSKSELSSIKSPLSPATAKRIPSTGDLLLVWNDHDGISPELRGKRTPLSTAISRDDGKTWEYTKKIESDPHGWYCYIAIDFTDDNAALLGYCSGDSRGNGLSKTSVTRIPVEWLYQESK